MGFINVLLFIIKYGPAILQLIKSALELIRWLRENDTVQFASDEDALKNLEEKAKRCRKSRSNSELEEYVKQLERRKAEVERRRKD